MCAFEPVTRGTRRQPVHRRRGAFESALGDLFAAIARRKIEPICVAYTELRRSSGRRSVRDILDRLDRSVGREGLALIVSSYSHRRCYMCDRGVNPCRSCGGSVASDDGQTCLQCDGLGVEACDFCGGSGLADAMTVPEEVRREAGLLRLERLDRRIHQLFRMPLPDEIARTRFHDGQRAEMASWLIRVLGRVADLTPLAEGNGHTERFESARRRARAMLEALRIDAPAATDEEME